MIRFCILDIIIMCCEERKMFFHILSFHIAHAWNKYTTHVKEIRISGAILSLGIESTKSVYSWQTQRFGKLEMNEKIPKNRALEFSHKIT